MVFLQWDPSLNKEVFDQSLLLFCSIRFKILFVLFEVALHHFVLLSCKNHVNIFKLVDVEILFQFFSLDEVIVIFKFKILYTNTILWRYFPKYES